MGRIVKQGFLALVLVLLVQAAYSQQVGAPRLHVLGNGLRVITVEDHSTPIVTTVWGAHVGDSAEPPDFTGNSHYLEHLLLFRGTEDFPGNQIGEWVDGRGGYFNGHPWHKKVNVLVDIASASGDSLPS